MNNPVPQPPIPGMPPPAPELNRRRLWLSLLLPPGTMAIIIIIFSILVTIADGQVAETSFTVICVIVCLASLAGWILFMNTMCKRFRGGSLVILILAYPIAQAILLFSIFFVGCLALIWSGGRV